MGESKSKKKFTPFEQRILIRVGDKEKKEEKTKSGIILPETVSDKKKQPNVGIVEGFNDKYTGPCKIGDKVMFDTRGVYSFTRDNVQYVVAGPDDVYGRFES